MTKEMSPSEGAFWFFAIIIVIILMVAIVSKLLEAGSDAESRARNAEQRAEAWKARAMAAEKDQRESPSQAVERYLNGH